MVNESPAPRSLQHIVEKILQLAVKSIPFRGFAAARYPGAGFTEDAAPFGAFGAGDEQSSIPAGVRGSRIQAHEAHLQLLLSGGPGVNASVTGFLHHGGDPGGEGRRGKGG